MSVTDARLLKFFDFHDQALARISALPGVKHVAFAWGLPLTGNKWFTTAKVEGQPNTGKLNDKLTIPSRSVTPEYFDLLGQKILAGRNFPSTHSTETNRVVLPEIAIVNQEMAERYFPNASPVGMKLRIPGRENQPIEIIGVVANARTEALTRKAEPEIYFSLWEALAFTKSLVIRTASDPQPLIAVVQRELRAIEPTVAIENIKTMEQIRSDSVAPQTFAMRLLVGFSFVASTLALVGIYGVLSLSVGSRKREIAIRSAIGAQPRDIVGLVLREGFRLMAIGLVFGAVISLALSRILSSFLFGVQPTDPVTLLGVMILFAAVALLACYPPARRATKVDPMEALRHE
jgi:putative ABC transport system permease protein